MWYNIIGSDPKIQEHTCKHLTVCMCPTIVARHAAPTHPTLSVARSHTYKIY